jgi:uncharacterized protein (TIGR00159 family)
MIFLLQIGFMNITFWDVLDVLIVGFLLFQIYRILRGSLGFNIFLALVLIWILWWLVESLGMPLLSSILRQFINVGIIALLIVFQPEVRRFLILVGQGSLQNQFLTKLLGRDLSPWTPQKEKILSEILKAIEQMSTEKTGALILISHHNTLEGLYSSGIMVNAEVSAQLLISIFNKNSPLHDGATIISGNQIVAASCVLPVSDRPGIPQEMGLRHRAAIGITESSNSFAIIISEESGQVSYSKGREISQNIEMDQMIKILKKTIN